MASMHIDVMMPSAKVPEALDKWFDENLPLDIVIRRGKRRNRRVVCITIYGMTLEDMMAKLDALEALIELKKK